MNGKVNDRGLLVIARADLNGAKQFLKEKDEVYVNMAFFHISQSVEKLMKFLCVCNGIEYDYSHLLVSLADKLEAKGVEIPQLVLDSLADYAKWATQAGYVVNQVAQRSYAEKQIECVGEWIISIEKQLGVLDYEIRGLTGF